MAYTAYKYALKFTTEHKSNEMQTEQNMCQRCMKRVKNSKTLNLLIAGKIIVSTIINIWLSSCEWMKYRTCVCCRLVTVLHDLAWVNRVWVRVLLRSASDGCASACLQADPFHIRGKEEQTYVALWHRFVVNFSIRRIIQILEISQALFS